MKTLTMINAIHSDGTLETITCGITVLYKTRADTGHHAQLFKCLNV